MEIFINSKKVKVFEHEDEKALLEKYVLKRKDDSLYYFFHINERDYTITPNLKLSADDIRENLKEIRQEDLIDNLEILKSKYTGITSREIALLWADNNTGEINLEIFKNIDKVAFTSSQKLKQTLEAYKNQIKARLDILKKRTNDISEHIDEIKGVKTGQIELEETIVEYKIRLNNKETLLDIFNSIEVSSNVPFVYIKFKQNTFFKVFTQEIPPEEWLDYYDTIEKDGIYFKILNETARKKIYGNGSWNLNNHLQIEFISKNSEIKIRDKFLRTLGNRIDYNIISSKQKGVRCFFMVENVNIERYIFADLIFTNDLMKNFFFLDEKNKTITNKPRIYIHYTFGDQAEKNTLGITVTQKEKRLFCRVSFSQNVRQANSARIVFSKLLSLYLQNENEIKQIYENIIPDLKSPTKTLTKKEDKKAGKRIGLLKKYHPDLFGSSHYSVKCQKKEQPIIISEEEAQRAIEELGENKVLKFENSYYVCEPREPGDTDDKYVYPGLKENKSADLVYKQNHPYLPCCFIVDQYEKEGSKLNKYLSKEGGKKEKITGDYIVGSNKLSQSGRYGDMPFNWKRLFKYINLEKEEFQKKSIYPFLRQGVITSPKSFLLCLEKAFDRDSDIEKVCTDISNSLGTESYSIKQETYNYTIENLKEILEGNSYIAPEVFISIAQYYYDCNIFLYVVDSANPDCNIMVPNSAHAYLEPKRRDDLNTVIIIAYEIEGESFPYQCELVSEIKIKNKKIVNVNSVFASTSRISKITQKMFEKSNEVFVVNPSGYSKV